MIKGGSTMIVFLSFQIRSNSLGGNLLQGTHKEVQHKVHSLVFLLKKFYQVNYLAFNYFEPHYPL